MVLRDPLYRSDILGLVERYEQDFLSYEAVQIALTNETISIAIQSDKKRNPHTEIIIIMSPLRPRDLANVALLGQKPPPSLRLD